MENTSENENLKFENEFLKLKLSAEKGAEFSDTTMDPKLENDWLNYITAYEDAAQHKRMIRVFDKIERPDFSKDLTDEQIPTELEKLLEHLAKYNIKITTLCEVNDKDMYKFIVEDLFKEEMIDLRGTNSTCVFTYEDFHPNHAYDIEDHIKDFINAIIKRSQEYCTWGFSFEFTSNDGLKLPLEEVKINLIRFIDSYSSFTLHELIFKDLFLQNENASQEFFIKYEGQSLGNSGIVKFEGVGVIRLINEYDYWSIAGIDMPGIRV